MAEIKINIPKISLFKDEEKLFTDLLSYLSALENLFRGRNSVNMEGMEKFLMQEKAFIESVHHDDIERVIYALHMIVSNNDAHEQQQPIFSAEFLSGCRHDKKKLQQLIQKYNHQITRVKECQHLVWVTRSKVHKYSLMVYAAESSIQNYTHDKKEYKERNKAIKEIKRDLATRMKSNTTNAIAYEKAVLKANVLRKRIATLSSSVQANITEKINLKITTAMGKQVNENAGIIHTEQISGFIYKILSRAFSVIQPPSDCMSTDFNKVFSNHDVVRCMFSRESAKKGIEYKTPNKSHAYGDVFDEVNQLILDLHKLDAGDKDQNRIGMEREQIDSRTETSITKQKKGLFTRIKERLSGKYNI